MTTRNPTAPPPVTLQEYAALPQRPRYELVKGVLIEQMGASDEHEETVALVIWRLSSHVYPSRLGRVYSSNRGYVTVPDSPASHGCLTCHSSLPNALANPTSSVCSTTALPTWP